MTRVRTLRPHQVGQKKHTSGEYETYAANAERLAAAGVVEIVDDAAPESEPASASAEAAPTPKPAAKKRR